MKRLFLLCGICIVSQIAVAQCKITITLSVSGCSNTLDGRIAEKVAEAQANHYLEQARIGFNSLQECNTFRSMVISQSYSYGNCKIRFNVSPCTGCPSGAMGNANILAIGQGSSFYSVNGANEIRDWSNDDMERMIALNREYVPYYDMSGVNTGDREFDNVRSGYILSGSMPGGSFDFIEKPHDNNNQDFEDYMIVGGARIPVSVLKKPFHSLGEGQSDDLKYVNIELKPVESFGTGHYDNEEGFVQKPFRTIDEKMDWYQSENPNVFQYIYTKWGKDNVIAGVDWWERNDVGNRLQNAYNTVEDAVSNAFWHPIDTYNSVREVAIDKLKEGVTPTIQFFIPPQYEKLGNNAIEIANTNKGIIDRTLSIVKNAPDMLERGEVPDITHQLKKNNDDIHNLGISVVNPGMSKSIRRLQAVEDIYNLPKDKQKKGLTDLLKREGKGIVESEVKKSEKYQKMKKKGKAIVDPYNFIFD